jgi:cytochrome b561
MTDTGFSSRPKDYAPLGKALHWVSALIVLGIIPAGIVMTNIGPSPLQNQLFDLHRSFGVAIFALALWRVVVRLYHGAPAPYAGLTKFERIASAATHHTLYLLLLAMPVIGWLMTSAYRVDVSVFGLFTLPHLAPKDEALFILFQRLHFAGAILMTFLVLLHIAGAVKHTLVNKDIVLWRMLPKSWGG